MNDIVKKYYNKSEGEVHLNWRDVEESAGRIVTHMREDNFVPDIIISIARSGLIPASLISYAIGNKELYVIKMDFSNSQKVGSDQDMRKKPKISQELTKDIGGLKVLVVDEMVVSGATLQTVSTYLDMKDTAEVKYCVLYKQPWSEFQPDYYGAEVRQWPIFPWKRLKEVY